MLTDTFGRFHNYLRISLTDNCNFRCFYCMPDEKINLLPNPHLMSPKEIETIASAFVAHGVNKIRLTGGEPLVRKEATEIIERLSALPVELTITTNGMLLHNFLNTFKKAGIKSINISLDTLNPLTFKQITRRDEFNRVWENIHLFLQEGFHVKVNMVAMEGINDHEINDFVALTKQLPLHVRFIEFMPFTGNNWMGAKVVSFEKIMQIIAGANDYIPMQSNPNDTAKKFTVVNHIGTFAVISTMSEPFCSSCNRLRLTADGKLKNCLFSKGESDLLSTLRTGGNIDSIIAATIFEKEFSRGGQIPVSYENMDAATITNRSMISIGG